jgi:hypothetical protein
MPEHFFDPADFARYDLDSPSLNAEKCTPGTAHNQGWRFFATLLRRE